MRNGVSLTIEDAMAIAEKFQLIPECPRGRAVTENLADILIGLCRGVIQNPVITPLDQAKWLVDAAVSTWDKWLGVPALRRMFQAEYCGGDVEAKRCAFCDDGGLVFRDGVYERCACRTGRMIHPSEADEQNRRLQLQGSLIPEPSNATGTEPSENAETIQKILASPLTQADVDREVAARKRLALVKQREARAGEVETEQAS